MNSNTINTATLTANMLPSWGSDEVFRYISENISNSNYNEFYDIIALIIARDTKRIIYGRGYNKEFGLAFHDVEDIVQEVQLSVLKGLVRYHRTSWNLLEPQRNSWLKVLVERRCFDYISSPQRRLQNMYDYIDIDKETGITIPDNPDRRSLEDECTDSNSEIVESICAALQFVFTIDTAPQKILGFIANKLSAANHDTKVKNGEPLKVCKLLNGLSVREATALVFEMLSDTLNFTEHEAFADVLNAAENMLATTKDGIRNEDRIINISPDIVTKSSYWISKKLRAHYVVFARDDGIGSIKL